MLKNIILRQQIVTLARTIKIAMLHPYKWRKCFIETSDMCSKCFPENPIGKALKRSEVNLHGLK